MTNAGSVKREMTPEEVRARSIDFSKKTLENRVFQGVLGLNNLRSNPFEYGQLAINGADASYQDVMASKEVQDVKNRLYKQESERGKRLGVFGEPSISNYDVSAAVIEQINENMARLSLGDLSGIVSGLGKNFGYDFEVPEALKGYVPAELQAKFHEGISGLVEQGKNPKEIKITDVLNAEEADAFDIYQRVLQPAYTRSSAMASAKSNYFADMNALGKQYAEKYKPKEDVPKSGD